MRAATDCHELTGYVLIVQETALLNVNDQYDLSGVLPYPPVWELQGAGTVTSEPPGYGVPPWFNVRLTFADGTRVDVVAVVDDGRIAIEDLRADPPLPLEGFAVLADRIEDPLEDACGIVAQQPGPGMAERAEPPGTVAAPGPRCRAAVPAGASRPTPTGPRSGGRDPVLAVMSATGRNRRKALRLIAGARDEGYLAPRHNRRRTIGGVPGAERSSVTSSASG